MVFPIVKPRVRETSTTTGTGDITLNGAMRGSLAFADIMITGDTCDICISYDDSFEECEATLLANGHLQRGTVYQALHANGDVDNNHVSFAAGTKTVILTFGSERLSDFFTGAVRFDEAQTLTDPQKRQALDNLGVLPSGTKLFFPQTAVPPGWTLDTTHNDKAIRIVNTTGGGSGGSSAFSTVFGKTATDNFTIAQGNLPNVNFTVNIPSGQGLHNHTGSVPGSGGNQTQAGADSIKLQTGGSQALTINANTLPAMTGTAASGGAGTALTAPIDIRVRYVDTIIGVKD